MNLAHMVRTLDLLFYLTKIPINEYKESFQLPLIRILVSNFVSSHKDENCVRNFLADYILEIVIRFRHDLAMYPPRIHMILRVSI